MGRRPHATGLQAEDGLHRAGFEAFGANAFDLPGDAGLGAQVDGFVVDWSPPGDTEGTVLAAFPRVADGSADDQYPVGETDQSCGEHGARDQGRRGRVVSWTASLSRAVEIGLPFHARVNVTTRTGPG